MPRATTTERGLGQPHRLSRQALLDTLVDGTPCPYCDLPMTREQDLDADHSTPRSRGGTVTDRLAHSTCNRKAGSALAHAPRCQFHPDCGSVHSRAW